MREVDQRCSKDKAEAIQNIKQQLIRHQQKLRELTKQNGPYYYDTSPDRDQYNFVHGMVYAYRELLYCFGVNAKEVDEI